MNTTPIHQQTAGLPLEDRRTETATASGLIVAGWRPGAAAVLELPPVHKDEVQKALGAIDRRLFAERQLTYTGEQVWCVVFDGGDQWGFQPIYELRDELGRALPHLTWKVVHEVQRMYRRGPLDLKAIDERNQARQQARMEEMRAQAREAAAEYAKLARKELQPVRGNFRLLQTRRRLRAEGFWEQNAV